MTRAIFTSTDGGASLPAAVIDLIGRAHLCAADGARVDLQVMCFAFTDRQIAQALLDLCRSHKSLTLRIVADWNQSARGAPTVLEGMAAENLPNLFIKFKLDVPYRADTTGRLRYSYAASLGMLHHKTLLVAVDGVPQVMSLGSYNWSMRGRQAYENMLLSDDPALLTAFAAEFAALWSDHRLSAATDRARIIMARLKSEAVNGADLRAPDRLADILGVLQGEGAPPPEPPRQPADAPVMVAFSGSRPTGIAATAGHALAHDRRRIDLLRPSGQRKPAPLTLNTLALEAIRSVPTGATLKIAIYALSPRVPEFAEILAAARRGVHLQVLLDGTIGARMANLLCGLAAREGTRVDVAMTRRRMHQKYLCCPDIGLVLTGTANMTEDATGRHSDHRILWRDAPDLARAFTADFETILGRLGARSLKAA